MWSWKWPPWIKTNRLDFVVKGQCHDKAKYCKKSTLGILKVMFKCHSQNSTSLPEVGWLMVCCQGPSNFGICVHFLNINLVEWLRQFTVVLVHFSLRPIRVSVDMRETCWLTCCWLVCVLCFWWQVFCVNATFRQLWKPLRRWIFGD